MQDALNLIEFANGAVTSEWCNVRAQMAHPASFNLIIMGVGNENWGSQYVERLKIFSNTMSHWGTLTRPKIYSVIFN